MCYRVFLFKNDFIPGQFLRHFLDLPKIHRHTWSTEFNRIAYFTGIHAGIYIIGFNLFRSPPFNAGGFMFDNRIGKDLADQAGHLEVIHRKCRCRTYIRLGFEPEPEKFCDSSDQSDKNGIQVLLAHDDVHQAAGTRITTESKRNRVLLDIPETSSSDTDANPAGDCSRTHSIGETVTDVLGQGKAIGRNTIGWAASPAVQIWTLRECSENGPI